jgi:catalase
MATKTFLTASSVLYDAVLVPGGKASVEALLDVEDALEFVYEAWRHCKPIGASGAGVALLDESGLGEVNLAKSGSKKALSEKGVVTSGAGDDGFAAAFIAAVAKHRHWDREERKKPPV